MTSKNSILDYYAAIVKAAKASEPYYCYNEDKVHNAAILSAMLCTSNNVRMYCGTMSIFRNKFWENLADDSKIKETFLQELEEFAKRQENSLEIVVENYPDGGFKDYLREELLKNMFDKGNLKLFKLSDSITFKEEIPHFSIASPCFVRVEQDKERHTALCAINNQELMDSSNTFYTKIEGFAEPILTL